MVQHPTFVEDLRIAAELLSKRRSILAIALDDRADELAQFDPYYSPEWRDPIEPVESEGERIMEGIIQTLDFACAHKLVSFESVKEMKAPDRIYMPNELLSEEWTRHIEGQDTDYIRKDALLEWLKLNKI